MLGQTAPTDPASIDSEKHLEVCSWLQRVPEGPDDEPSLPKTLKHLNIAGTQAEHLVFVLFDGLMYAEVLETLDFAKRHARPGSMGMSETWDDIGATVQADGEDGGGALLQPA